MILFFSSAALVLILDQISKHIVASSMELGSSIPVIKGVFELTYIRNTGAAWGAFSGATWILAAVSFVIVLILFGYYVTLPYIKRYAALRFLIVFLSAVTFAMPCVIPFRVYASIIVAFMRVVNRYFLQKHEKYIANLRKCPYNRCEVIPWI